MGWEESEFTLQCLDDLQSRCFAEMMEDTWYKFVSDYGCFLLTRVRPNCPSCVERLKHLFKRELCSIRRGAEVGFIAGTGSYLVIELTAPLPSHLLIHFKEVKGLTHLQAEVKGATKQTCHGTVDKRHSYAALLNLTSECEEWHAFQ